MIRTKLNQVEKLLIDTGLKAGDNVLIHADLRVFGLLEGHGEGLISLIKEIVGINGSILTPSFTFSFPENFDIQNTKSSIGALTNLFSKEKLIHRMPDGMTSYYILGEYAHEVIEKWDNTSYGKNSVIGQLHRNNGKVLQLGTDILSPIHYLEEYVGVPYRESKRFEGIIINKDQIYNSYTNFYARNRQVNKIIPDPIRSEFYSRIKSKVCYNSKELRLFTIEEFMNFSVPRLTDNKLILVED